MFEYIINVPYIKSDSDLNKLKKYLSLEYMGFIINFNYDTLELLFLCENEIDVNYLSNKIE